MATAGRMAPWPPVGRRRGWWLGEVLLPPLILAIAAASVLGMLWGWDVAAGWRRRRLSAELAVADERLRFAADLHDIQGHHLQVIALSELARTRRWTPARRPRRWRVGGWPPRPRRHPWWCRGYRRTTLDEEIANATRVLAAAGIDARMNLGYLPDVGGPDRLATPGRHLLGLVMQATTNVLRHSQARHAEVDLVTEQVRAAGEQRRRGRPAGHRSRHQPAHPGQPLRAAGGADLGARRRPLRGHGRCRCARASPEGMGPA